MTLRFVPPPEVDKYGVYIEGRGLTIHGTIGGAKGRIRNATGGWSAKHNAEYRGALLLKNIDGDWFILYDVKKGEQYPWIKEVKSYSWPNWGKSTTEKRAVPMTNEEYAEWRLKVEEERRAVPPKVNYTAEWPSPYPSKKENA